jgi:magnesium transporter
VLHLYALRSGAIHRLPVELTDALPEEAAWIDLARPTPEEEALVEKLLGIDIPTREELSGIQPSIRLVAADGTLYMSALVPDGPDEAPLDINPVTLVRTDRRLITVRYNRPQSLEPFVERFGKGQAKAADIGELLAALLEVIVERVADHLENVGVALDRLGHSIFNAETAPETSAGRKAPMPRRTRRLQKVIEDIGQEHQRVNKLRDCAQSISRLATFSQAHADEKEKPRLKAIEADLHSVAEYDAYLADNMQFLLDATVGLIDIQQNKVIYLLSIVSVVLTPPVLVASIYGMNFKNMPELGWPWGYAWGLGLMLVSAIGPFLFFKLKGWL